MWSCTIFSSPLLSKIGAELHSSWAEGLPVLNFQQTAGLVIWAPSVFYRSPEEREISCQAFNCFLKRPYNRRSAHEVREDGCRHRQLRCHINTNWNLPCVLWRECPGRNFWLVSRTDTCCSVLFQVYLNKIGFGSESRLRTDQMSPTESYQQSWFLGISFAFAGLDPPVAPSHSICLQFVKWWFTHWDDPWFVVRFALSHYWSVNFKRVLVTGRVVAVNRQAKVGS